MLPPGINFNPERLGADMPKYTDHEKRHMETVRLIFEGPAEFDRLSAFAEDAVWWNGLPHIGNPPGTTEHRGKEAIGRLMAGSQDAGNLNRGIDAYDLTTTYFEDVLVLADGNFVMRQHTQRSKTLRGRDYCNVYCFVFRFNEEHLIETLTEHWNTWYAHKFLLENWTLEPAHP